MIVPTCPFCASRDILAGKKWCICDNCGERFPNSDTPSGNKMKLFISYSHKEEDICREIVSALKARGHKVWFDHSNIQAGDNWREKITEGIKSSNGVIAFLSEHSVRSPGVCLDELSIAIGIRGGNIKTVLLENESKVEPPASISYIQWLDMSEWREYKKRGKREYTAWFNNKFKELARVIETPENVAFSGQISAIKESLPMICYDNSKQSSLLNNPFIGRKWLTSRIENWLNDPKGSSICILYGDPGIGKSAFAANYCHYNHRVIAGFFCEHNRNIYNQTKSVIQTLAYLLACRLPDYRQILSDIVTKSSEIGDLNSSELFSKLITYPLTQCMIDGGHETVCIVIDGLDECGDYEYNAMAEVISQFANRFPGWIRLFLTARRVSSVTSMFQGIPYEELSEDTEENIRDIKEYFTSELGEYLTENSCPADLIDTLVRNSNGIFLYGTIMVHSILNGMMNVQNIDLLPKGITNAFLSWFRRFFRDPTEYLQCFRLPLGVLAFSPEPFPEEEFTRLFSRDENETADLKRRISVLIRCSKNAFGKDTIEVSHKYVKDWLDSEEAGVYRCIRKAVIRSLGTSIYRIYSGKTTQLSEYEALYAFSLLLESEEYGMLSGLADNPAYFLKVCEIGSRCLEEGKIFLAQKYFDTAFSLADYCMKSSNAPDTRLMYSIAELHLAEINELQGNLREAGRLYEDCYRIRKILHNERGNENDEKCFGLSCERLAEMYIASGNQKRAQDLLLEGLAVRQKIDKKRGSAEDKRNLASNYMILAELYQTEGMNEKARELFKKSFEARLSQYSLRQGLNDLKDLIVSGIRRASFEQHDGKYETADHLIDYVLKLTKQIPEDSRFPEILRAISFCYAYKAQSMKNKGQSEEAERWYKETLILRKQMVADRGSREDLWNLGGIYMMMGGFYYQNKRLDEAEKVLQFLTAIDEELVKERGKVEDRKGLCYVLILKGRICTARGKLEDALQYYETAEQIVLDIYRTRSNFDDREDYAYVLHGKAYIFNLIGKTQEAEALCDAALSLRRYQIEHRGSADDYKHYGASLILKGILSQNSKKYEEAQKYLAEAVKIDRKILDERHSISDHSSLCFACILIAEHYLAQGLIESALPYAEEAVMQGEYTVTHRNSPKDQEYAERAQKTMLRCSDNVREGAS